MSDAGDSTPSSPAAPASGLDISAVSLKIPPFWASDPEVWFAQVEATFTTRGISVQKTKFDHVIASLTPEVAMEVRDLILQPPVVDPYDVLRRELTQRTGKSKQHRLQQLLTVEQLGDRRPTQLLRRMEQLMGTHAAADSALLKELFLQRLPAQARMVLAQARMVLASADDSLSLSQLAQMADKILDASASAAVASVEAPSSLASDVGHLRAQVSQLQESIQSFQKSSRPYRSPSGFRSTSPRPASPISRSVCWYHQKYGAAAKKCKSPCDWVKGQATR